MSTSAHDTRHQGDGARDWFANRKRAAFKKVILENRSFDSERAARELARILEENDPDKRLRREISRMVWPRATDTKYFYKLLIHPNEPVPRDLQKRPKVYWKVGCAIARCAGYPEDTFTIRLFDDTEVAALASKELYRASRRPEVQQDFDELACQISEMTDAVIRQNDLATFCRFIATTTGQYNAHDTSILSGALPLLTHGPLEDSYEVIEEWPPVPSAVLYRDRRCPDFDSRLLLAPDRLTDDTTTNEAWGNASRRRSTKRWKPIPVRVTCWREVRLAIGPADASLQPRPLFELRTVFSLAAHDSDIEIELLTPWLYDQPDEPVVVRIRGTRRIGTVTLRPKLQENATLRDHWGPVIPCDWPIDAANGRTIQSEHRYATWRSVTPALCHELLKTGSGTGLEIWSPLSPPAQPTLFPADSVAALVEEGLISGAIETTLTDQATQLRKLVDDYRLGQRGAALARHQLARQRWQRS